MEEIKLFDSELKLMELLWSSGPTNAKSLSLLAEETIGWNKNTTYTVLKKLIEKNVIKREEPNFVCIPLITKDQVRVAETCLKFSSQSYFSLLMIAFSTGRLSITASSTSFRAMKNSTTPSKPFNP